MGLSQPHGQVEGANVKADLESAWLTERGTAKGRGNRVARGKVRREVDLGGDIERGHILLSNLKEDPRKLVRQIWESRKFSFHKETHLSQQSTKRDLIRGY